jgi:hypothetical protein
VALIWTFPSPALRITTMLQRPLAGVFSSQKANRPGPSSLHAGAALVIRSPDQGEGQSFLPVHVVFAVHSDARRRVPTGGDRPLAAASSR